MRLDRVAEDIYIMISELYAQVTATVILTNQGAVVVDTLPYPSESRQLQAFIDGKLGANQVRYVVATHSHADHIYGAYLFESAEIIAQDQCRDILKQSGPALLERAKRETASLAGVVLRLPQITFQEQLHLHIGLRHLKLIHTPGHTADCLIVFAVDDRVVIAGDTMMPIPHIVRGDGSQLIASLRMIQSLKPNFIIQGHGDVLLRGEIDEAIDANITYINTIVERVSKFVERKEPINRLREIDIESCGLSRIPLDGLVSRLHFNNLLALYKSMRVEQVEQPD